MVWLPEHAERFLAHAAGDRLSALWRLLCYSGLRRGEAAALRWSDIDLDGERLFVRSQFTVVNWVVSEGPPKSNAGFRHLGIGERGLAELRAHRKRQAAEQL